MDWYYSCTFFLKILTSSFTVCKLNILQASSASVDVVPLFLGRAYDLEIDDEDLIIVLPSKLEEEQSQTGPSVYIHHKPTGISVQSSGAWWFTGNHYIHSLL
jgi:hypothetical protein